MTLLVDETVEWLLITCHLAVDSNSSLKRKKKEEEATPKTYYDNALAHGALSRIRNEIPAIFCNLI